VSWAAHELESFVLRKHIDVRISFLAILVGCLAPDLITKTWTYGFDIGGTHYGASNPAQFHRGWPGVGFTHSLMMGVIVAGLILVVTKSRAWSLGLLIGYWAHVLTDTFDSVGTMLLFPFSTQHFASGMWAYAAQQGKYGDAAAYYSSLGGIWDIFWLLVVLVSWRVLTKDYFRDSVIPDDPAWAWLRRKFRMPNQALLAFYRAYFFYAVCRITAWMIWAHAFDHSGWDLSWGGPYWVKKAVIPPGGWATSPLGLGAATACFALTLVLLWKFLLKRYWDRANDRFPVEAAPQAA
jgi:membrane-bound metal-dependent hydrolase YbcI (DUF457 family)